MRLPSASKLDLGLLCLYWLSPHAPKVERDFVKSAAGEKGDGVHLLSQRISEGHESPTDGLPPEVVAYETSVRESLATLPEGDRFYEVAMAFDVDKLTARILPTEYHRDYRQKRKTEIAGTVDIMVIDGKRGLIRDTKTGQRARDKSAAESSQLRMLALCAARIYGLDEVQIELAHLDPDIWYIDPRPGSPCVLDAFDLAEVEAQLRRIFDEVTAAEQVPRPGAHCWEQYCDLRNGGCPVADKTLAAIAKAADEAVITPEMVAMAAIETDGDARKARVALKMYDAAVERFDVFRERLDAALKEYVRRNGAIDVGGDRFFGLQETTKDTKIDLSVPGAVDVIRESLGDEALEFTTSKEAMYRAAVAKGKGALKRRDAAVERLRELGAVKSTTYSKFHEFTKKKDDAA